MPIACANDLPSPRQLEMRKALSFSDTSRTTQKLLSRYFSPTRRESSRVCLVEEVPGIEKSLLLQEISYRWSKKQLLQTWCKLRNPAVQPVSFISDLLQLFCKGE